MKRVLSYLTFWDKIIISVVIAVSSFFIIFPFFSAGSTGSEDMDNIVFVIQSAHETLHIPASETFTPQPQEIAVRGPTGETIIEMHEGRIRVKEEPEEHIYRIAERQGWIDHTSLSGHIINLPNHISIEIENREQSEDRAVDGVTQ